MFFISFSSPAISFVTSKERLNRAIQTIKEELKERLDYLHAENKPLEAQRLEQRTMFDLEMISELGYCNGIENYSRHLTGRNPGSPPPTLLDYFPDDFILFADESHITIPQIGGMYSGDRSRKQTLVDYGFRLPSALDNRPLKFEEFEEKIHQAAYVSATPGNMEIERSGGRIVEQIIRPTGLLDPAVEIRPAGNQVDDLLEEIRKREEVGGGVLVTTLTKRMAEDLQEYYQGLGVRVEYLHSDIKTLDRIELIRRLRHREFQVLVGINLLREGLDIPEVSMVAVLDADKEGFLRSERSLTQTCGRAARNVNGLVIFYGDRVTGSMQRTVEETERRRLIQEEYNREHNIEPRTIHSTIKDVAGAVYETTGILKEGDEVPQAAEKVGEYGTLEDVRKEIAGLEKEMKKQAEGLAFEKAAELRDKIKELKDMELTWM